VKAEWEPDELIETWTLTGDDWDLVGVPGDQVSDRRGRLPVRDLAAGDEAADIVRDLPVPARVAPVCTPTGA
jgi:hypothetical protein